MAQEQTNPEQKTEPTSSASKEAPSTASKEAPESNGESPTCESNGSLPWSNWNMESYTTGMRDAYSAWSTFVSEQYKAVSSYDLSGNIASQAADAWRGYAKGVAGLSSRLVEIASDVSGVNIWTPGGNSTSGENHDAP